MSEVEISAQKSKYILITMHVHSDQIMNCATFFQFFPVALAQNSEWKVAH